MTVEDDQQRIDREFLRDLNRVKIERVNNKLEKKLISFRELTRMLRSSSVYRKLIRELGTLPRRENGK